MGLGTCGEWLGGVLGGGGEAGRGVEKTSKINIFKNVWEYFSCVGGIKIRGLGILLDQKIEKSKFWIFGIWGSAAWAEPFTIIIVFACLRGLAWLIVLGD